MKSKVTISGVIFWLVLVTGVLSLASCGSADIPAIEYIQTLQQPTPNPVVTGAEFMAQFEVHLKNANTNQEIDSPPGTSYAWSCTSVTGGSGMAPSALSFSPQLQTTTMTGSGTSAGTYTITIQVVVSNPAWVDSQNNPVSLTGKTTVNETVQDVVVTFSPASIQTGVAKNTPTLHISTPVTATVMPASATQNVKISVGGQSRISIANIVKNSSTGQITFTITGKSGTPANVPAGDTTLTASVNGTTDGTAPVVVLVPATCTEAIGAYSVVNTAYPSGTTPPPPFQQAPAGMADYVTQVSNNITITVNDQFGGALNPMFNGNNIVEETIPEYNFDHAYIEDPDNVFMNGVKLDQDSPSPSENTAGYVKGYETSWANFMALLSNKIGTFNNAIGVAVAGMKTQPEVEVLHQTITVAGTDVTPVWIRTKTTYPTLITNASNNPVLYSVVESH